MGSPFPLCDLLCHENKAFLDEDEEAYTKFNPHPVFESEDEYVRVLIQKESIFEYNSPSSAANFRPVEIPSWLKYARLDEIEWVIDTRPLLGYQYGTAFLSLTYFDRFISTRKVNSGSLRSVRLLSVACLALAAKMLETKPPSLSEYDIDDHHDFKSKEIYETELLVLNALHWKMGSITPFAYLNQFTTNFCLQYQDYNSANLAFTAAVLIFAFPKGIVKSSNGFSDQTHPPPPPPPPPLSLSLSPHPPSLKSTMATKACRGFTMATTTERTTRSLLECGHIRGGLGMLRLSCEKAQAMRGLGNEEGRVRCLRLIWAMRVQNPPVGPVNRVTRKKAFSASDLLPAVRELHDNLVLFESDSALLSEIASLCEEWWREELPGRETLISQSLPFLVSRSLTLKKKVDVHRVYVLREAFALFDFEDESIEDLKLLLIRCLIEPLYLKTEDGRKFIAFVFGLNGQLLKEALAMVRSQIPFGRKSMLEAYADIVFRAWRVVGGPLRDEIESGFLQGLVEGAIHAASTASFAASIRRVVGGFISHRTVDGVEKLLFRLAEPVIFRSLQIGASDSGSWHFHTSCSYRSPSSLSGDIRTFQFHKVVRLDLLLSTLANDQPLIAQKITKLLMPSYFPSKVTVEEACNRCVTLIKRSPMAGARFCEFALSEGASYQSLVELVKVFISLGCVL
ncbi:ARM repeat superfamily protein [Actinidia rufa]|uniref:ARM repeat superfamily protein n=1 Tax=Actinidia rufa TaxID=165716 RepID=A0A7J0H6V6_9ERIC|nr:ARM repeat superfamily protein [Actinidia rufa]